MAMEPWQKEELKKHLAQVRAENPVIQCMHGTRYVSHSNGRGRKPRKVRLVTLASWQPTRWRADYLVPWDELATEILGDNAEGQKLKDEFNNMLNGRKF